MKKLILIIFLVMGITFAQAQDYFNDDQVQTIFSKNKSNGAYGAFTMGYSQINGRDALITGARGAFIFDHQLAIGIGGYGFVNNIDYHSYYNNQPHDYTHVGGYGGFFIEPIVGGTKPVHVAFPLLIGMGGVALIENYNLKYIDFYPLNDVDYDIFLVIEPAIELEFNLTRWLRTAASISYRYTSKIELYNTDKTLLRGLNFGLTFKFGKF